MKILIVDDHGLVREGLQAILRRSEFSAHYLEAWDAASLRQQLEQNPDTKLVLLDIQLPGDSGLDLLDEISSRYPRISVIMLSADHDTQTVTQSLQRGASGFLPKSSLNQVLVSAIQLVLAGGVYVPPEALSQTVRKPMAASQGVSALGTLGFTARQAEVFRYLLLGMSNKQICRELGLAEPTVKIHVRGILRSFNVSSRAEVIAKANQLGLNVEGLGMEQSSNP